MATVTLRGNPVDVAGTLPARGARAPGFTLTNGELKDVGLADFSGKRKVLNIVPSLDTPTCAVSTRKFNAEAGSLPDTVVLVISADLPFAAKRFCSVEGLDNVVPLSTFRNPGFATDWGVALSSGPMIGLTARAVVVLDKDDTVLHAQLVPEIAQEPDYEAAKAALG